MNTSTRPIFPDGLPPELEPVLETIVAAADKHTGEPIELLRILRFLENLHQWLRDGYYMESLPTSRQELFELLLLMEQQGNWPSLPRTQLHTLLTQLYRPELSD